MLFQPQRQQHPSRTPVACLPPCLQAMSNAPGNVAAVRALIDHPAFNITNPNNCYSLFLAFARSPVNMHAGEPFLFPQAH
jgi:hypothetical protein